LRASRRRKEEADKKDMIILIVEFVEHHRGIRTHVEGDGDPLDTAISKTMVPLSFDCAHRLRVE
jgi:hypothetical protein